MTDKFLKEIREKISCPQFGDDHYGEWGILNVNQRRTIKRLIDYMDGQEAYIKNQQAEIEEMHKRVMRLDSEREEWSRSATAEKLKNIELQLEIEQLKKDKDGLAVALANAVGRNVGFKEDIERLQNDLAISRKETKRYATRRAEAIKEFAERLKEIYRNVPTLWGTVAVKRIDNLVKEMVGEE